ESSLSRNSKSFRTSRQKSAWSCETNMSSDTGQATKHTMRAGAKLKLNYARLRDCLRLVCMPRRDTTRRATSLFSTRHLTKHFPRQLRYAFFAAMLVCALGLASFAQIPIPNAQPLPPGQTANSGQGQSIKVDVNLVVLHTSVLDDRGKFVEGLTQDNFRVLEDKQEQKLAVFKREDVPVSMGLVIDNSASMRDKRPRVNEAALTLVQTSNPQDEAFVVNFNDDFYLDLDKDFTNSIPELKEALERIDSRGRTALYDTGMYTSGLLSEESKKNSKRAKKAFEQIAQASGGLAFFPENVDDVRNICEQVARDIRNQYTLAYYPSNVKRDGTYRTVQVEVIPPRGRGKLVARTRNGYYAPAGGGAASGK